MNTLEFVASSALAFGVVAAVGACGSESEDGSKVAAGGSGGASGSSGSGGSSGTLGKPPCNDTSDCAAGQFCSIAKVCVAEGGCAVDDDCSGGQQCSSIFTCIAPGSCAAPGDCGEGETCDEATQSCVPGGGCGAEPFEIEAVVPNLFISLDRSCSMNNKPAALPATKWKIAVDALVKMTTDFNGKIRWGLGLFPDIQTPNCAQAAAALPVAVSNEGPIQTLLTSALQQADPNFPNGPCVTNIDTAMEQASLEPAFADPSRPSYVLLITDGNQAGCNLAGGDAGTTQIIQSLFTNGVPTFVIGFGAGIDPNQMNIFADAGGVPNNDPNVRYYKADDQVSLDAALATIGGKVANCSFKLQGTPPDPNKLFVFFDKLGVTRDPTHTNGWDYDPASNTITFYGQDCQDLKDGKIGKVDVVFGCNQPPLQ